MQFPMAAGLDSAVAGSTFARLTQRPQPERILAGNFAKRVAHRAGETLAALPRSMWLLADLTLLAVAMHLGYAVIEPQDAIATPHMAYGPALGVFASLTALVGLALGLYDRETLLSRARIAARTLLTAAAVTALAYAVIYVLLYATISRRVTTVALTTFAVGAGGMRLFGWWAIHRVRRGLLVVGSRALYESFERAQTPDCLHEYRLVGFASVGEEAQEEVNDSYLGRVTDVVADLRALNVSDIIVAEPAARDSKVMDWMVPCLQRGCRVTNEAIFYEKATGQILVDEITPLWFLFADLKIHCDQYAALKRLFDVVVAAVGVCLSAPLWPLIAVAVKLCDGGPAFYSQDRVGQNGQVFKLYKFRTMRTDAENGRSVWASPNDPRVTRIGRLLRRSRMDELPQLYNVLVGQMSIVGPRPERPDIVRDLCGRVPWYAERHLVKPGITGWAQISFRYGASIEDAKRKLQYDLYYLKHMSFELDFMILLRTVGTFLRGGC